MRMKPYHHVCLMLTTSTLILAPVWAQPRPKEGVFPSYPFRFVVPYAAGGNGDIVSRIVGQRLASALGQPVVIDNRAGAGGNVGAEIAARAAPDGYTLVLGTNTHAINMSLYAKPGYDFVADFAPVSLVSSAPMVLVVHPSLPVKSVRELIALAKAHPGRMNYATGGNGSSAHVITELFKSLARVDLVHVPYGGVAQGMTDLMAGQIQVMFNSTSTSLSLIQAGRMRALGITTASRSPMAPGMPTVAESGLPGFEASIWQGVLVPAKTPAPVIERLHREFATMLAAADTRNQLFNSGVDAKPSTPGEFSELIVREIAKWGKVVKSSGAKID
jgi:tripartite-type tricarboxylate transporter receptor subunit TctC